MPSVLTVSMNLNQLSEVEESTHNSRGGDDHDDLQSAIDDMDFDVSGHSSARRDAEYVMDTTEKNEMNVTSPSPDEENPITALTRDEAVEAEDTQNVAPSAPAQPNPSQTTFEGVLAEDPSQIRDSMLQNAVEAKDVRVFDETGGKWKRWMPFAIGGLVLLVLIAVGVSLGVVIPRQRNAVLSTTESPSASSVSGSKSSSNVSFVLCHLTSG